MSFNFMEGLVDGGCFKISGKCWLSLEFWSEVPLPSPEASIEELKSSLMKVKKESEKAG